MSRMTAVLALVLLVVLAVACGAGPTAPSPWPESSYLGDQAPRADVDPLFRDACFRSWWTDRVSDPAHSMSWRSGGFEDRVKWVPNDWNDDPATLAYFRSEHELYRASGHGC